MTIFRWNLQIWLSVCMLLLGCGKNSSDKTGDVPVIDIVGNLGKYETIPISRFVTELEYIPLETNYDFWLGEQDLDLVVTSTHIFVLGRPMMVGNRYCYAFDRDGRYLGLIGSVGQGPGEYTNITNITVDENNQSLYLETFRTLLEYSYDGISRGSIRLPENRYGHSTRNNFFVRDGLFIGHFMNRKGDLENNFILFDRSSEVIKSFENYMQFYREHEMGSNFDRSMKPYRIAESVYVKELGNDTLFRLNKQNELVPQVAFNLGKYTSTKEKRESENFYDNTREEILIPINYKPMTGTPNHIFFSVKSYNLSGKFSFPKKLIRERIIPPGWQDGGTIDSQDLVGIYDVTEQTTQFLDTDPVSRMMGMINDLDGGLSFWPRYYTSNNELVDVWLPSDMKELLTEDYFAAHEIKNPEAHQKLKELVQKLDEEDNPVIVIAKLKE